MNKIIGKEKYKGQLSASILRGDMAVKGHAIREDWRMEALASRAQCPLVISEKKVRKFRWSWGQALSCKVLARSVPSTRARDTLYK
jgi:hypothetical protein